MGAMVMARRQRQRVNVLAVEEIARRGFGQGHDGRERSPAMRLLKLTTRSMSIAPAGAGGKVEIGMMDVAAALAMSSPVSYHVRAEERPVPEWDGFGEHRHYTRAPVLQAVEIVPVRKKLSSDAYYFAMAKYLQDAKAIEQTYFDAWIAALDLGKREGWRIAPGKEILRNAAKLAMSRHLERAAYYDCKACGGTGGNRKGACSPCGGSGRKTLSDRTLAEFLGTDHKNYVKTWVPKIDAIDRMIRDWDQQVLRHLWHQFLGAATDSLKHFPST